MALSSYREWHPVRRLFPFRSVSVKFCGAGWAKMGAKWASWRPVRSVAFWAESLGSRNLGSSVHPWQKVSSLATLARLEPCCPRKLWLSATVTKRTRLMCDPTNQHPSRSSVNARPHCGDDNEIWPPGTPNLCALSPLSLALISSTLFFPQGLPNSLFHCRWAWNACWMNDVGEKTSNAHRGMERRRRLSTVAVGCLEGRISSTGKGRKAPWKTIPAGHWGSGGTLVIVTTIGTT